MYTRLALGAVTVAGAFVAADALAGTPGITFVAGLVVMDAVWAIKLGIPQAMYHAWKHRNDPPPQFTWDDYADEMISDREDVR